MTADIKDLDAHEQPSDELRARWKTYARAEPKDLLDNPDIDDLQNPERAAEFCLASTIPAETLSRAFQHICPDNTPEFQAPKDAPIYYHPLLPGLLIAPSLVPPQVQKSLLGHLIHRDLSNPTHQTNLHPHYDLPYPAPASSSSPSSTPSFFSHPPTCTSPASTFTPKDPAMHRPLSIKQALERRLHWVTLGGQYDWTRRVYPGAAPPPFPADVAAFLETLFPATRAQAAIVNLYTPGDTMMMHRDVSEETDKGLVSLSLGCDGLFMIAPNGGPGETGAGLGAGPGPGGKGYLLLRLRSGDAVYMTEESRFAWHGVPRVLKGTCPGYLEDWPAEDGKYEGWRGWMGNKRVNLNVRQMRD
ncbi:hypothetical protein BT67DRAFT_462002 [Trichocladium antarcticum]|uniref:mRNA N(6)-methyladenine demethylase n=1 Tax=Trichocladium antarcticum TaxID=1450529 RepID=A0AAN6ULN4_9PEZI|nr:hypothetical protein BT67DRAFT_462002 [Trichocladium antarcticum]